MPRLITLEANISSGKTTIISFLKEKTYEDVIIVKEPVDEWLDLKNKENKTILELFYFDQKEYGFTFQIYALYTRYMLLKDAFEYAKKWEINNPGKVLKIITERTILSDYYIFASILHEDGFINDVEMSVYKKWFTTFSEEFTVNKIIYVRSSVNTCFKRIALRNRNGENMIKREYLEKLHDKHENLNIEIFSKYQTLIIENEFDMSSEDYQNNLNLIINFIMN